MAFGLLPVGWTVTVIGPFSGSKASVLIENAYLSMCF